MMNYLSHFQCVDSTEQYLLLVHYRNVPLQMIVYLVNLGSPELLD